MKLGILSSNFLSNNIEELKLSKLASNRLRLNVAKDAAIRMGIEVEKLDFYKKNIKVDFILIGKFVHQSGANIFVDDDGTRLNKWLDCIINNKKNGCKIILDYTDNLIISNDYRSEFYRRVIPFVDLIVVPSLIMKESIRKYYTGEVQIIEEPLEEEAIEVRNCTFDKIRALWFGHPTNLIYLFEYLKKVTNIDEIVIVTSLLSEDEKKRIRNINKKIKFEFIQWEKNFYSQIKNKCNICLIPSNVGDARKNGASNNRLITAFALDLIPVASMIGSYVEYSDYFIDIDCSEILSKKELLNISEKLKNNRKEIIEKYTLDAIIGKWISVLDNNNIMTIKYK